MLTSPALAQDDAEEEEEEEEPASDDPDKNLCKVDECDICSNNDDMT